MRYFSLLIVCCFVNQLPAQLNLELLAHVPNESGVSLAGCWHYVDSLENEYALVGTSQGMDIYDVSIPTQPVKRFQIPGISNNWREVKTWGGCAYVGSEAQGSGITIVDLRELPDTVYHKVWLGDDSLTNLIKSSHTVGAEDGYLYVFGSSIYNGGAIICSLEDPWNPTFKGLYNVNYLHDGFVRGDTLWGSEIYKGQFSIIDISDKTNPVLITTQPTPAAFNHNTGLSKNSQFIFTTDEKPTAPLGVFDVSDPGDITLTDKYYLSQKPASPVHNVRVIGDDYLVCPSYGGQLSIVDASDPYNLIETAWVVVGNSLVWDADPYLPSGIVFAGAKAEGFFIFKPTYVRAARLAGTVTDANTGFVLDNVKVFVEMTPNADTTVTNGKYATGAATGGAYTVRAEKNGYETLLIPNVLLTNGTTVTLDFAMTPAPVSTGNITDPQHLTKVYPTLNNGQFWVEGPMPPASIRDIVDNLGKTVHTISVSGNRTAVNARHLPPGVYYVKTAGQVVGRVQITE